MTRRFLAAALTLVCLIAAGCGGSSHSQTLYKTRYGPSAHAPTFGTPPRNLPRTVAPATAGPVAAMFDSVTVSQIPTGARAVAGYTSGLFPTFGPLSRLFGGHARVVSIAIASRFHADCLDVEPGDATPAEAPGWVRSDIRAGFRHPCVYGSLSEWSQIRAALNAAHISPSMYFGWDADWTNVAHIDSGFQATQWTDHAFGRNLDETLATYAFLGLHVAHPVVKPRPHPKPTVDPRVRWRGALSSSEDVYIQRYCPVLSQRVEWFAAELKSHPRTRVARRQHALVASRNAYRARACPVFAQRIRYFTSKLGG